MKFLIISGSENTRPGGVFKTVMEISKNLSKMNHEVILLQSNPFNLPKEEMFCGFKIIRISNRFENHSYGLSYGLYVYLKKNLTKMNPDIILVHGYHTLFSAESIYFVKKMRPDIPIIFSTHIFTRNTLAGKYLWGIYNNLIGKKIISLSDILRVASKFEENFLIKTFPDCQSKIRIIHPGVQCINSQKTKKRTKTINLLYVGYLIKLKGVQYIIETVYELKNRNVDVSLTIVGGGSYEKELKKLAKNLNVDDFIHWEGVVKQSQTERLFKIYKKAEILLLLSKSENYGNVVAESLAMGTPAIVTKTTALVEFMELYGCFGVDYPPDPKKLADTIIDIHQGNILVGDISHKIKTWRNVANEFLKIGLKLLQKK